MHGPDSATRFQNLTTQQVFSRIPQDNNVVKMISFSPEAPGRQRRGRI